MRVYSVDPSDPFLRTLAERLVDGTLWPDGAMPAHPLALSRATVYLPTRRAARALSATFLDVVGGPTALPRIEALGESADEPGSESASHGHAVIGGLEARAALASLIVAFARSLEQSFETGERLLVPTAGPDAVRLADELLALMDQVETQEADWADLPGLVDRADLAGHWQITTRFLTIATTMWPALLTSAGKITAATARREEAEAAARKVATADGPIVVAGSTGSIPPTRRLIRAIAQSPLGAVVLPGFDRVASAEDWAALAAADDGPSHPQYGMKQLIDALGVASEAVVRLAPRSISPHSARQARAPLIAAAFRPAPETHRWLDDRAAASPDDALQGVALIEGDDERAEAAAVAVAMREAVASGGRVALVTPHRPLARRVSHALRRWQISVDDSAGEPLAASPAGVIARLVASVAIGGGAADWLALLKHPLAARPEHTAAARAAIERQFRGPRIAPAAIPKTLAAGPEDGAALAAHIVAAVRPLSALQAQTATVATFAAAHEAAVRAVIGEPDARPDIEALFTALAELATADTHTLPGRDWPATFDALIDGIVVRTRHDDAAVAILGPLEARLQGFDHVILGGLNEGVWPTIPDADPWMSRSMMRAFGLDLPERKIGLSAHDVFVAAHAPRLTLSRAKKAGGEPKIASRWWQRLVTFAGDAATASRERGDRLMDLADTLDVRPAVSAAPRPAPAPPLSARPTRISVTDVARLVRDPYALYAKRVLRLRPLDPLEADPDAADRGELVHTILKRFIGEGHHSQADAHTRLAAIIEETLHAVVPAPEARALWGARLHHVAPYLVAEERARLALWHPVLTEASGAAEIAGVTLHGRIDRIDAGPDGVEIIDYKTGTPPSAKAVSSLIEPQLPLEALLLRHDGLPIATDAPIAALTYVRVAGGRVPVEWRRVDDPKDPAASGALIEKAAREFAALVARYQDPQTGYLSRARVPFESDQSGDYDHLARTAEWQT